MKKLLLAIATVVACLCLVAAPVGVSAQFDALDAACENGGGGPVCNNGGGEDPIGGQGGAIIAVTSILALIAGIVSVIFLVIGGLKYITSNGDSSSVSSAKSTIVAALIGLVIAILARPIINFVVGKL